MLPGEMSYDTFPLNRQGDICLSIRLVPEKGTKVQAVNHTIQF